MNNTTKISIGSNGTSGIPSGIWKNISLDLAQNDLPNELVRKYEVYESTEDLLVLSCAWYRLRLESAQTSTFNNISKLLDRQLFSIVNEEDRILASTIRDYYSKKIMMLKLKNERTTKFTEDLNKFIHSDGTMFVEEMFGLAYRLPQFYFYDKKLDDIFSGRNRTTQKDIRGREVKLLNFIDKTVVERKHMKRIEYWFSDEDDCVVGLYLTKENPLVGVFENLIQKPLKLEGLYYRKNRSDIGYYQVEKYNTCI